MPLDDAQKREVMQLVLVAEEYLRLGNPPQEHRDTRRRKDQAEGAIANELILGLLKPGGR
jgi:hypothetical protein